MSKKDPINKFKRISYTATFIVAIIYTLVIYWIDRKLDASYVDFVRILFFCISGSYVLKKFADKKNGKTMVLLIFLIPTLLMADTLSDNKAIIDEMVNERKIQRQEKISLRNEIMNRLALVESSNNPKAVSFKKAVGLYQIRKYGALLEYNNWHKDKFTIYDMYDRDKSFKVAYWYLFDFLYEKKFKNNFVLALSSYQCGMKVVRGGVVNHTYVLAVLGKNNRHYKEFMDKYHLEKLHGSYYLYFDKAMWEGLKNNSNYKHNLVAKRRQEIRDLGVKYFKIGEKT